MKNNRCKEKGGNCAPLFYSVVKRLFFAFFIFLLPFLSEERVCQADPIGLNANWSYQQMGGDVSNRSFIQNYNIDFSNEITRAIYFSGAMRYSRLWLDGVSTTTLLNPTLRTGVNNDLFRLELSTVASERITSKTATDLSSNSVDFSNRSWEATWVSNWRNKWLPSIRLLYGEDYSWDDQTPRFTDDNGSHLGANVDWDLSATQLSYSYYAQKDSNKISHTEQTGDTHSARLHTSRSFWNDRLTTGFSQQVTLSSNQTTASAGANGEVLLKNTIMTATSGVNRTPIYGSLVENGALKDLDFENNALQIPELIGFDYINIGIVSRPQIVDVIYLYTTTDITFVAKQFQFDLYTSEDGVNWAKKQADVTYNYNSVLRRFELEIPRIQDKYLKLVITRTPLRDVFISEIETYRREVVTGKFLDRFQYLTYNTDMNLGFKFTHDLNFAYNFSLQNDIQHPAGNNQSRYANVGSLMWTPTKYFAPTLSINDARQYYEQAASPDTINRSYALKIASSPLPTLDMSMGVTDTERYENNQKISTAYNYNLYATATIFPDLNASFDTFYNWIDVSGQGQKLTSVYVLGSSPLTQSVNEAWARATRTFGSRLTLSSRVATNLNLDISGDYNRSLDVLDLTSKSCTVTAAWRISELLSLRGIVGHTWEDQVSDSTFFNMILSVAPTYKTQTSFSYSYAKSTVLAQSYGLFWSWNISRFISFSLNGSYQMIDEKTPWYIGFQLNTRFFGF